MVLKMMLIAASFLFTLVAVASPQDFSNFLEDYSKSVTGQTYLFVGDNLELNCTLGENFLQKNYTAKDIFFQFQFRAQGDVECVPASRVEIISNDVARLVILNVSEKDVGPYGCYVGKTHCQEDMDTEFLLVGFSDDVKVEYPPQNVTNFTCIVYNWDVSMKCTWIHPIKYVDKSNIQVTTVYRHSNDSVNQMCPVPSYSGCDWTSESLLISDIFIVSVTVTNTRNNATATKNFKFDSFNLVKPAPVENLSISEDEERPGCFLLVWNHSRTRRGKVYRIEHTTGIDNRFQILADNLTDTYFMACKYPPYTYHNFSVQCYPTFNLGFWSDPVFITARTRMTKPKFGPRITNGSFTTTSCKDKQRNVTVMWQEIEESAQNGKIYSYHIKLDGTTLATVNSDVFSAKVELPCYSTSVLEIVAQNEAGNSLEPSVLYIFPVNFSVPQIVQDSFSVEVMSKQSASDVSLRALWERDTGAGNLNYTIFWCYSLSGQSCSDQIKWTEVTGTKTDCDIPIPSSDDLRYLFGISVTDTLTNVTSGIFWTDCVFNHEPSNLHQTVESLTLEEGTKKVKVSWIQIPCSYKSKIKVTNYTVKWCQSNRCNNAGDVFYFSVPAKKSSYTVSELKANIRYSFTVQLVSYGGETGDEVKPWIDAVPVEADSPTNLLPVLIPIFLAVIILMLLAVYIYRKCIISKRRTMKLLNTAGFIQLEKSNQSSTESSTDSQITAVTLSTQSETIQFLPRSGIACASSSDSECEIVSVSARRSSMRQPCGNHIQESLTLNPETVETDQSVSAERSNIKQEPCGNHQQDEKIVPETSNSEIVQPYQQIAYLSGNQLSEPSSHRHHSVSSNSAESYQHLAYSQSNQLSDLHTDLESLAEEDDSDEQPSMSHLIKQYRIKEISAPDTATSMTAVTPPTPLVPQLNSIILNVGVTSSSDVTGASSLIPDSPNTSTTFEETSSSSSSSCNSSSNSATSYSSTGYLLMNTFPEQFGAKDDTKP